MFNFLTSVCLNDSWSEYKLMACLVVGGKALALKMNMILRGGAGLWSLLCSSFGHWKQGTRSNRHATEINDEASSLQS